MSRLLTLLLLAGLIAGAAAAQDGAAPATDESKPAGVTADPKPKADENVAKVAEIRLAFDSSDDPTGPNPFSAHKPNLREFFKNLEQAARDPEVAAIELKPMHYNVGTARLLEIREKLEELRRAGKKIFFYRETLSTADLVLASTADRISIPESGMVFLPGLAIESWYMKDLLAKLRIKFDVIHIGDFKTAGESMVRDSMSDAQRQSLDPILDEFFESIVGAIAKGRNISTDKVKAAIDEGMLSAKKAKEYGLIDRIEYRDQFAAGVRAHFPGKKVVKIKNYPHGDSKFEVDPDNPIAAFSTIFGALMNPEAGQEKVEGPKIAVVYCTGAIVSGKSQYDWSGNISAMGSETIVGAIRDAARDKDVKAIVLRINSPGGSGLASDMIWRAIEGAKAKGKTVVSSMADVAASGGYYIAMNSDVIVAEPQTITGSIGVVGMVANVDALFPWVGIKPERLTRGKRAAALMTSQGLSDDDKEHIRGVMADFYKDFVGKVAAGRGKSFEEIELIARGRVWTGRKAKELGLIDELGGLERAIAIAREKAGLPADAPVIESPNRGGPFEALQEMFEVRLGLTRAAIQAIPGLERGLLKVKLMQRIAADRICCVAPELTDLTQPISE